MQSAGPVRLGLDVRPSTAGAGRAGAAAVLVLQRVCVAHAAVAARVVVPTPASSPTPASIVAAVMVVDQTSVSLVRPQAQQKALDQMEGQASAVD